MQKMELARLLAEEKYMSSWRLKSQLIGKKVKYLQGCCPTSTEPSFPEKGEPTLMIDYLSC